MDECEFVNISAREARRSSTVRACVQCYCAAPVRRRWCLVTQLLTPPSAAIASPISTVCTLVSALSLTLSLHAALPGAGDVVGAMFIRVGVGAGCWAVALSWG